MFTYIVLKLAGRHSLKTYRTNVRAKVVDLDPEERDRKEVKSEVEGTKLK